MDFSVETLTLRLSPSKHREKWQPIRTVVRSRVEAANGSIMAESGFERFDGKAKTVMAWIINFGQTQKWSHYLHQVLVATVVIIPIVGARFAFC